jgi:hypothetical protein
MNATEVRDLINYWEKDIERIEAMVEKIKSECTHVTENGVSTVGPHKVHAIPGSAQTGTAVCGAWITKDVPGLVKPEIGIYEIIEVK